MSINCKLDAFKIPGIPGLNFPFGSKNANDVPIWDDEAVTNAAMPFTRQRPFIVAASDSTTEVQAHSTFNISDADVELTLANGGFIGCEVKIVNTSDSESTVIYNTSKSIKVLRDSLIKLEWNGTKWKLRKTRSAHSESVEGAGRNLFDVLGVTTIPEAMAEIRKRCNNNAEIDDTGNPYFDDLRVGDYLDGLSFTTVPAPSTGTAPQAWNDTYKNNRVIIAGFNTYKHSGDTETVQNHVAFVFRDIIAKGRMNSSNTNSGGYASSEARVWLEGASGDGNGAFALALKAALGGDYLLTVKRLLSTKGNWGWCNCTVFLNSEDEFYGSGSWAEHDYGDAFHVHLPIYRDAMTYRVKRWNGVRDWHWTNSPSASSAAGFCHVNLEGFSYTSGASAVGGFAPAFCVR